MRIMYEIIQKVARAPPTDLYSPVAPLTRLDQNKDTTDTSKSVGLKINLKQRKQSMLSKATSVCFIKK